VLPLVRVQVARARGALMVPRRKRRLILLVTRRWSDRVHFVLDLVVLDRPLNRVLVLKAHDLLTAGLLNQVVVLAARLLGRDHVASDEVDLLALLVLPQHLTKALRLIVVGLLIHARRRTQVARLSVQAFRRVIVDTGRLVLLITGMVAVVTIQPSSRLQICLTRPLVLAITVGRRVQIVN
jgi:hypothetical protein